MRHILFCLSFIFFSTAATAQLSLKDTVIKKAAETKNTDTVAWVYGATLNIGFNQGFIHNWAAGGELASLTVSGLTSLSLSRLYHRHIWNNNLYMSYGLFYAYSNDFVPRKTDDRIDFTSKYGIRLDTSKDFYLTTLFNFITQFNQGHDYDLPGWDTFSTSKFLSPAYATLGLGLEYRKGSNLNLFLSPVAARLTLADKYYTLKDPEGAFGINYGETSRFELGAYFSGVYKVDIAKDIFYKARLTLYSNYLAKDKTDSLGVVVKKDNPGNIDMFWDNIFSLKLGKRLNLLLNITMQYDNDIPYESTYTDENGAIQQKDDPGKGLGWFQMKQTMSFGLRYEL